ncbi:MAG TPA: GDSL family lipase [Clostridiales bacterium]|nr:GDSL family lipase [Clostridiales bacterium]
MNILKRLSEKNADTAYGRAITLAFLGDSVTQGCFELFKGYQTDFDGTVDYEAVYHAQLKKMLGLVFPGAPVNIINAGIGGNSARQGYERLERDVLSYSPDLAVVCFGLNDVCGGADQIDQYVHSLSEIFKKLKAHAIETVFMTPNMLNTYPSSLVIDCVADFAVHTAELQNNGVMDAYMDAARKLCADQGIPVCDCYAKWRKLYQAGVDTTKLLANHINHPTREMHLLFAAALFDLILF